MPDIIETLIEQVASEPSVINVERVARGYDAAKAPPMACQVHFTRLEFVLQGTYRNCLCDKNGLSYERDFVTGDCLLLPPKSWNKIIWVGEFVGFSLLFGPRQLGMSHFALGRHNNSFTNVTTRSCPLPAASPIYGLLRVLSDLQPEHDERAPYTRQIAQAAIGLALHLLENPSGEEPTKSSILYYTICNYIQDNYNRTLNRDMVSETFSISTHYLSKLFHIHGQSGFSEYVNSIRLEQARRMLTETMLPLAEISESCGFHDRNYFCRVFKSEFGRTPTEFRKGQRTASSTVHPFNTESASADARISEMLRR